MPSGGRRSLPLRSVSSSLAFLAVFEPTGHDRGPAAGLRRIVIRRRGRSGRFGRARTRDRNQTRVEFLAVNDDRLLTVVAGLAQRATRGKRATATNTGQVDDAGIGRGALGRILIDRPIVEAVASAPFEGVREWVGNVLVLGRRLGCGLAGVFFDGRRTLFGGTAGVLRALVNEGCALRGLLFDRGITCGFLASRRVRGRTPLRLLLGLLLIGSGTS